MKTRVALPRPSVRAAVISLSISAVVAAGQFALFFWALADSAAQDEMSLADFFAMVQISTLGLVLGLAGWSAYVLVVALRHSALATSFPSAYVATVVVPGPLAGQLGAVAGSLGVGRPRIWTGTYVTFVADSDSLRFYNGVRAPRERLAVPMSALTGAAAGSFSNGMRTVAAFALTVTPAGGYPLPITLVPVRFAGIGVGVVRPAELPAELQRMQRATHPATV